MPSLDTWMTMLGALVAASTGGVSAYIAIRADLIAMKATLAIMQHSVQRAHERIDAHVERGHH